jgi:hypothetical protein
MKLIRISVFVFLAIDFAGSAWAQGLYGAPDSLQMQPQVSQPQQPAAGPYSGVPAQYAGQAGYAPVGYSQQVAPYNAPSGYVAPQPQYSVPAGYAQQPAVTQPTANSASGPVYRTAYAPRPTYSAQPPMSVPSEPVPAANAPIPQQNPSLTNQMLSEQGQTGAAGADGYVPYDSSCGPCRSGVEKYQDAACGELACGNSCLWYGSLTGLALSRNEPNQLWVSNEAFPNENLQTMKTSDAQTGWKLGGEIRFGRRFCCCGCDPCNNSTAGYWAIEADYWTTDPFQGYASFQNANGSVFGTPLQTRFVSLNLPGGAFATADNWYDRSLEQRIWRRDEVHSAEINLVRGQWANVCGSNWDFAFSTGPRFFRFYEDLRWGTLSTYNNAAPVWGGNGGLDEVYVSDQITNNLFGAQIGVDLGYNFAAGALRLFITPKVGIYDNSITSTYQMYQGNGALGWYNYNGTPQNQVPIYSSSTTNAFSVLAQVDVGAEWFFLQRWSARVGYRLVSVSGVGLADNQIPPYLNDLPAVGNINTNGELFLHGAFATVTFNF